MHLASQIWRRYLTCPEQYRLYYVENLRPKIESASLIFEGLVHLALADFLREGVIPEDTFLREWDNLKNLEFRHNKRTSWGDLTENGKKLLERFLTEELPKIQKVYGIEKKFELAVTTMRLPFIGIVDLIAQVDGQATIIDFKTAASGYEEHEVSLSDQLTAYWLADPTADRVAYCILPETNEAVVEWRFAKRDVGRLAEYLAREGIVSEDIGGGSLRAAGKHCGYGDFLPVCLGDKESPGNAGQNHPTNFNPEPSKSVWLFLMR